jgi:polar amino acid transport system substrate-binding protein
VRWSRVGVLALVLVCTTASSGWADDLAPTGTLRATFLAANPVQGVIDTATGAVSGPAVDLGRALARRQGVGFAIDGLAGVQAVIESVTSGVADIGFLAYDPARAVDVDFSQPYSLAYNTYLVPAASALRAAADVDRPGIRIGVGKGDAADLYLGRTLKHAELRPNAGGTLAAAMQMFASGEIDAYAANRQRLVELVATRPDMRVLPDNFLAVEQAIVVRKGDAARLAIVDRFIEDARASGLIRAALDRAKLVGVDVAPARGQ